MSKPTIESPRVEPLRLPGLVAGFAGDLEPGAAAEGLRLEGVDLAGRDLTGAELRESELVGVAAHEAVLRGARLVDVRIERLDAPVLDASRSTWHRVELEGSRLGSADLHEAELDGVVLGGSRLGFLNLRGARLTDVLLRDCRLEELDLGDAQLERVAFADCTVERLVLGHARAQHLDLRGLDVADVAGLDGLRGAVVTEYQAAALLPLLADHVGFRIAD